MENWKKALIAAAAGTSVILLLQRKTAAGLVAAGVGLAAVASEYPEKFQEIRDRLPEYAERGTAFLDVVSRTTERLAKTSRRRGLSWFEALLDA